MKIIAAGFFTAILIFAVATAMSELLWTADETPLSESAPRRKSNGAKSVADGNRSSRSTSRAKRVDSSLDDAEESRTGELQSKLREIRQRESDVQTKQEALRLVYDEIRDEQQSVDQLRRTVSDEIAMLREMAIRLAQQERRVPVPFSEIASVAIPVKPAESSASVRPQSSLRDIQAVRDNAMLVKRLAQQGNVRDATLLLRRFKDRDAARVLAELDATDSEMALRLTQDLQAPRNEGTNRR